MGAEYLTSFLDVNNQLHGFFISRVFKHLVGFFHVDKLEAVSDRFFRIKPLLSYQFLCYYAQLRFKAQLR